MRTIEQQNLALECLKLAQAACYRPPAQQAFSSVATHGGTAEVVARAGEYFVFATGEVAAGAVEKVEAVRKIVG